MSNYLLSKPSWLSSPKINQYNPFTDPMANKLRSMGIAPKTQSGVTGSEDPLNNQEVMSKPKGAANILKMTDKVVGIGNKIFEAAGLDVDEINQNSADRFGFGKTNKLAAIANQSEITKALMYAAGKQMDTVSDSAYRDTIGSGFGASLADIDSAKEFSGKRIAFGAKKATSAITNANAQVAALNRVGAEAELAKQNNVGELYMQQNINKYHGFSPSLLLAKKGSKIPELENARVILRSQSRNITKYQLGGKIIDPSKNIIPDGALHKNRNHLSEYNDELKDQITEKGIPVVSENADGTITQHAEVEVGEVIFNLANTKIIEDYWQQYKETEDDSIAIECGKFLTKELLRNTVDKAGIKKNIE